MKVAFIGTGRMGRPMARNLCRAGISMSIYNRTPAPLGEWEALGAAVAGSAAEAVRGADVVFIMLSNGGAVSEVLAGGLLAALTPGTLLIDISSIHPAVARDHAALVEARGARYLDAPVSGGTVGAQAGTLAIMVGGREEDFERAASLLAVLGTPTLVGAHGCGQLCKLVSQAIVAVTIGAVAEGLSLARIGGADPVQVREAILAGFAGSRILELHGARMNERRFTPGGTIVNQVKDLDAVLDVAVTQGLRMPLTDRVRELFSSMINHGQGDLDHSALILELERLAT